MGRHGTQLTWDLDDFADLLLDDTDTARRHRVGFVMLEFQQSNDHFSPPGCDLSRHFSWECSTSTVRQDSRSVATTLIASPRCGNCQP